MRKPKPANGPFVRLKYEEPPAIDTMGAGARLALARQCLAKLRRAIKSQTQAQTRTQSQAPSPLSSSSQANDPTRLDQQLASCSSSGSSQSHQQQHFAPSAARSVATNFRTDTNNRPPPTTMTEKMLALETSIHASVDASCLLARYKRPQQALGKAKEALSKLNSLGMMQEKATIMMQQQQQQMTTNIEMAKLNVMVQFNLAVQTANCLQLSESFDIYNNLINKQELTTSSSRTEKLNRLGINMGNLLCKMGDFQRALKFYRLTYDRISSKTSQNLRIKLMHNIAIAMLKQMMSTVVDKTNENNGDDNDFIDANSEKLASLEACFAHLVTDNATIRNTISRKMAANANHFEFGLNLIVCRYLQRDLSSMKDAFEELCKVAQSDHYHQSLSSDDNKKDDLLDLLLAKRRKQTFKALILSAKLIFELELAASGCRWSHLEHLESGHFVVKELRSSFGFESLIIDLEMSNVCAQIDACKLDKALAALDKIASAIPAPNQIRSSAVATNLATFHLLSDDIDTSLSFARAAVNLDKQNAQAYNCLANCYVRRGEFDEAEQLYKLAVKFDKNLIEAHTNLCLCLRNNNIATTTIRGKLQQTSTIAVAANQSVQFLADNCDKFDQLKVQLARIFQGTTSADKVVQLLNSPPLSAALVDKFGPETVLDLSIAVEARGDSKLALAMLKETNKDCPWHLSTAERLIAISTRNLHYDAAISYLKNCINNRTDQEIWLQMLAECYRRAGHFDKALDVYRLAVARFPNSTKCLNALIQLSRELGQKCQVHEDKLDRILAKTSAANITNKSRDGKTPS